MRIETAAASHRGRIRRRNEDAYFVGECAFAVADGMGGHLAGDVASATALLPIQGLDGRSFADAASAQAALLDAILAANAAVVRKAADEPSLRGMGTTLTATIFEGDRLHVGHVGDSRAYLLRDGELTQLTRDHTLVAHLLEEGQITEEEAAAHPQRSIITRAIGVDVDLEVDTLTIELASGDQVLLCSDGLTGPVPDERIAATLLADLPADEAARQLVEVANHAGGPDNVTVVLLRLRDDDGRGNGHPRHATTVIRTGHDTADDARWANQLGRYGELAPDPARVAPREAVPTRRHAHRAFAVVGVVLVVLALAALGGRWLLARSYFVGLAGDEVVVYQGVPVSLGPLELYWPTERTDLTVSEVAPWYVERLEDGVVATSVADARRIVRDAPRASEAGATPSGTEPAPAASPGAASPATTTPGAQTPPTATPATAP